MKKTLAIFYRGFIGFLFIILPQLQSEARFSIYQMADSSSFQQFKGSILDSKTKDELNFASITVAGTTISTISNSEGKFSIKVPTEKQKKQNDKVHTGQNFEQRKYSDDYYNSLYNHFTTKQSL